MPFEHVSLDMITDLPECDGYDVVVVFVCMLSKQTTCRANLPITKTITEEQLAKVMHGAVLRRFGLQQKLICDRDSQFMSDLWQLIFRDVGTKLNISTSCHPH
jgi:hypothetical protein